MKCRRLFYSIRVHPEILCSHLPQPVQHAVSRQSAGARSLSADSGLEHGSSYSVHIRAKSNDGVWGCFVNGGTFSVEAPVPPQVPGFFGTIGGLELDGLTVGKTSPAVTYHWNVPSDPSGIERYQLVLQPTTGGWLYQPHVLFPATSHTIQTSGLQDGVSYSIHIRAKNNAGNWGPFINGGVFTVSLP